MLRDRVMTSTVTILVNNVGAVRPRLDGFLALTDDDWDWALTINFLAAVRTTRAALPLRDNQGMRVALWPE